MKSVLSDLSFCALGYFLSAVFLSLEMIWLSGLWIAASEVINEPCLALYFPSDDLRTLVQRQPGADPGQDDLTSRPDLGHQTG